MKVFDDKELNLEQLENVTGGTSPRYPGTGTGGKMVNTNPLLNNISTNLPKANPGQPVKPFDVCPKCHSTAVIFNREENICMCQDCGYIEDRSK